MTAAASIPDIEGMAAASIPDMEGMTAAASLPDIEGMTAAASIPVPVPDMEIGGHDRCYRYC